MRGKPRTADCTIFAVCLMVKGRIVVMREGDEEERKKERSEEGKSRSLCVLRGFVFGDDWPENMRGVGVGWLGWEGAMEGQTKKSERACIGGAYRVL